MPEGAEDREPCPDRTDTLPEERREVGRLPTLLPQQNGRHERMHRTLKTQVGDHVWLVTFMHYDLGYFGDEACRLEPIANPFGPKV